MEGGEDAQPRVWTRAGQGSRADPERAVPGGSRRGALAGPDPEATLGVGLTVLWPQMRAGAEAGQTDEAGEGWGDGDGGAPLGVQLTFSIKS